MRLIKQLCLLLVVFGLAACSTSVNVQMDNDAIPAAASNETAFDVIWESTPHSLGPGTGGQLSLWASEKIDLIQAVPAEGGMDLIYRNSHNEGSSFGKTIPVSRVAGEVSAHGENNPQLRRGPGIGIYAAWQGSRNIKFARSMSFGHSFMEPVKVNDTEGEGFRSFLTMEVSPRGEIYVAWIDGRDKETEPPGQASIYMARSTDQGATFGPNLKVAGNICPCCRPSLTFGPDGTAFMAWRHVAEGNRRVIVVSSTQDGGATWSPPVEVNPRGWVINGCAHSGPMIQRIGGTLTVVWYTASEGKARLLMAQSTDDGKSFGTVREVQGTVFDPNHPHMTTIGAEGWLMFQGRHPQKEGGWGEVMPWLVRIREDGTVSPPQPLPAGGNVSYPQLFPGNGGRLYAVWTQFGDRGPEVMLCRGRWIGAQ